MAEKSPSTQQASSTGNPSSNPSKPEEPLSWEKQLWSVLNNIPVMLDAFDAKGRIVFWNQECERVTGYSAEEIVHNPQAMETLYPDADYRDMMLHTYERPQQEYRNQEWELVCKDGSRKIISWSTVSSLPLVPDWDNWGAGVDVTESRRAEQELRRSKQRLHELHERIQDGIVSTDLNGVFQYCNPAYEAMLGYTIEELRRLKYQELTPERWHEMEIAVVENIVNQGYSGLYEKEYIRKDGSVFPVELNSYLETDADGRPVGLWGIARDITDRKREEQALRESERTLRQAQRVGRVGRWTWQPETGTITWSSQVYTIFGLTPPQPLDLDTILAMYHPDDRDHTLAYIQEHIENHTPGMYEARIIRPNGEIRWILSHFESEPQKTNQSMQVVGIVQDITEQKQREEEIRELNETLEQRVEERTKELRRVVKLMAGREVRMAELKEVIRTLRQQLLDAGMTPDAEDPIQQGSNEIQRDDQDIPSVPPSPEERG